MSSDDGGSSIPPSPTLYINNINEKVKKAALKKAIYAAFSQYGRILDIVACKTEKLRGQAWVVFADVGAATNAMKGMQSFALYEKPIKIQYARSKSHAIEKLEGSYRPRPKRAREEEPARESGGASKRSRTAEGPASAAPSAQAAAQQQQAALPSTKLLVQNLPALAEDVLTGMVKELFGRYPGLTDVRVVAPRRLAFVEYAHESASAPALAGLHGFLYDGTNGLQVTYAR